jgi:hypothetical protein
VNPRYILFEPDTHDTGMEIATLRARAGSCSLREGWLVSAYNNPLHCSALWKVLEPSYPREQPVLRPDHPGGPDLASSTPLDSSPVAEWDLLAALQSMDLARPDPAVWAAGGAESTNFSTDSVQPRVPSASPIQAPPGAAIARPSANRLPDATGLPGRLLCAVLHYTALHCTVLYCTSLHACCPGRLGALRFL